MHRNKNCWLYFVFIPFPRNCLRLGNFSRHFPLFVDRVMSSIETIITSLFQFCIRKQTTIRLHFRLMNKLWLFLHYLFLVKLKFYIVKLFFCVSLVESTNIIALIAYPTQISFISTFIVIIISFRGISTIYKTHILFRIHMIALENGDENMPYWQSINENLSHISID